MSDIYPWKALLQTDPQRIAAVVDLTALQHVEGYVWCDNHGDVHSDSLNPYGYIDDPDTVERSWCKPDHHRALYMEPDDIMATQLERDEASREPEPVRHTPVPLSVRRHTPESRQIWFNNLRAALPADMSDEDKNHIADALLETTMKMGDELRRKRLIDKLMLAAEALEDNANTVGNRTVAKQDMRAWSDLMADAAEEIRSVL